MYKSIKVLGCLGFLFSTELLNAADGAAASYRQTPEVVWLLVSAILVFFMQAGFKCLEVGLVREKNIVSVGIKNVADWLLGTLAYLAVGFAFMFGPSLFGGALGWGPFFLSGRLEGISSEAYPVFFLFQLGFAVTTVTIMSGAVAERIGITAYLCAVLGVSVVTYPIFGHWVWGNAAGDGATSWLANLGFIDFAGSTVVHSTGAWVALIAVWIVGPRIGRYQPDGTLVAFKPHNLAYSALGVLILWFGWFGFNGGSALGTGEHPGWVIVNTNIAGAAAGFAAFVHCNFFQKRDHLVEKLFGGVLGGLVAVTAGCHVFNPLTATLVGALAGVVHNYSFDLVVRRWRLDDAVGAIPVHGFCGVFGTLAVALFGDSTKLAMDRWSQLWVQFLGAAVCFVWSAGTAYVVFSWVRKTVGLRLPPQEEIEGITVGAKNDAAQRAGDDSESFDDETLRELLGA
ncbi:MAG: ammonium transporter [Planctomycetota bacterium]